MKMKCWVVIACIGVSASIVCAAPTYIQGDVVGLSGNVTQWSRGDAGSTWQEWTFDDADNPAAPEAYSNSYGAPTATMTGNNGSVDFGWYADKLGGNGVWAGNTIKMVLDIPNQPQQNPYKVVWFEMVYKAAGVDIEPTLVLDNGYQGERFYYDADEDASSDDWRTMVAGFTIYPNPTREAITLSLWGTGGFVNSVSVDTLCAVVPAPGAAMLAGLGVSLVGALRRFWK